MINGPENVVLAGDREAIAAVQADLAAHGVMTRLLHVGHAFHAALIEPALPGLARTAAGIEHRPAAIPLISNCTGEFVTEILEPGYWAKHARATVQFAAGMQALHKAGITHFLEIGPDAVLSRLGPACLAARMRPG